VHAVLGQQQQPVKQEQPAAAAQVPQQDHCNNISEPATFHWKGTTGNFLRTSTITHPDDDDPDKLAH
jgi:hypothetical protein